MLTVAKEDETLRPSYSDDILACFSQPNSEYYYFIVMIEDSTDNLWEQVYSDKRTTRNPPGIHYSILMHPKQICVLGVDESLTYFLQEFFKFNNPRLDDILDHLQILYAPRGKDMD
ncbi:hypothetical protein RF11_02149 [Thelohanellus kitauei]|uniref:Uncharacterized protein n=1 Tax=Thelohanellus kitauei TaxID=669202 RepID=A0A0C2NJT7_THEKT|nr:hypothetical protein RF11_02149 [Thelohanellus kitauei]